MTESTKTQIFWGSLFLAGSPLLVRHLLNMWRLPQNHYLIALFALLGLLIFRRWDRQWQTPAGWRQWAVLFCVVALCAVATLLFSPWVDALSIVSLLGIFLYLHRDQEQRRLFTIWPVCWLLIPPPIGLDDALSTGLQLQSSWLTSLFLDYASVPHILEGNVLQVQAKTLFVEEACGGVQSLFTVMFIGLGLMAIFRRPFAMAPAYLVAAYFWAGLMNVLRLFVIACALQWWGIDWSHGVSHMLVGYFSLGLAVAFLFSSDRFFQVVLFPTKPEDKADEKVNPLTETWNRLFTWGGPVAAESKPITENAWRAVVVVCALLFAGQSAAYARQLARANAEDATNTDGFLVYPAEISLDGVEIVEHRVEKQDLDLPFGHNADVWTAKISGTPATLAISQPYPRWHDLSDCYEAIGWVLNEYETREIAGIPMTWVRLVHPDGRYAQLWFAAFDEQLKYVQPNDASLVTRLDYYVLSRSLTSTSAAEQKLAMAQLFVESRTPITDDSEQLFETSFTKFVELAIAEAKQ